MACFYEGVYNGMAIYWEQLLKKVLSLKLILEIFMELFCAYAFFFEMVVYSRNNEWNLVLSGNSSLNFSETTDDDDANGLKSMWKNNRITFDGSQEELKTILRRNLTIPMIILSLLGGFFVVNGAAILYELFIRKSQPDYYLKALVKLVMHICITQNIYAHSLKKSQGFKHIFPMGGGGGIYSVRGYLEHLESVC